MDIYRRLYAAEECDPACAEVLLERLNCTPPVTSQELSEAVAP